MLQNDANAPPDLVDRAQTEVARLFDAVGVKVAWVKEVPASGGRLRVVSLTTWEPSEQKVKILAVAIAHELGHMLLPDGNGIGPL
jgi:hypothetical protein